MTEKNPTVTRSLFATVGAGDAIYAAVTDVVTQVRERANAGEVSGRVDEARERFANVPADVQAQFDSLRERLSGLPSELPEDLAELREKFTPEELRSLAEKYYRQALEVYTDLADRGEETVERLRANHLVEERIEQVEGFYGDARTRAEDVFDRVNGLLGRAGKAATDLAEEAETVLDAEVIGVRTEEEPTATARATAAEKTAQAASTTESTTTESAPKASTGATAAPKKSATAAKKTAAKKVAPKKTAPKQV